MPLHKIAATALTALIAALSLLIAACSTSDSADSTSPSSNSQAEIPLPTTVHATATVTATAKVASHTTTPTITPTPAITARQAAAELAPPPLPDPTPVIVVLNQEPPSFTDALAVAQVLAPAMVLPSDCGNPFPRPDLLPNSPRYYRSGTHQGVDFVCPSLGYSAVAAMDGRIVQIIGDFQDPTPASRQQLLDIAAELNATPPFTLLSLYGNYVVIDHGVLPFVGHIISIYAHLHEVDPNIRIGQAINAGDRVGEIGNKGTLLAAQGNFYVSAHLHWELHLNNLYLGAGLSTQQTRDVYTALFADAMG